jgi:hypothetical protein
LAGGWQAREEPPFCSPKMRPDRGPTAAPNGTFWVIVLDGLLAVSWESAKSIKS